MWCTVRGFLIDKRVGSFRMRELAKRRRRARCSEVTSGLGELKKG